MITMRSPEYRGASVDGGTIDLESRNDHRLVSQVGHTGRTPKHNEAENGSASLR